MKNLRKLSAGNTAMRKDRLKSGLRGVSILGGEGQSTSHVQAYLYYEMWS